MILRTAFSCGVKTIYLSPVILVNEDTTHEIVYSGRYGDRLFSYVLMEIKHTVGGDSRQLFGYDFIGNIGHIKEHL